MSKNTVQQFWAPRRLQVIKTTSNTGVTRPSPFSIDPIAVTVAAEKS